MAKQEARELRFPCLLLFLVVWMVALLTGAQAPLALSIEMNTGQAQLTVAGAPGTACQIQWTDNLLLTNRWFDLGPLLLGSPPAFLTDADSSSATQRYYRAVWTPSTNFVWISPGMFTMGSPTSEALRVPAEVQHTVTISRGFWMGRYLVTQGDYLSVVGTNPSYFTPDNGYPPDLTRPVEQVSWNDATNYCALRTQQERAAGLISTNYVYRLPTESEWEYADRAGTTTAFYVGSGLYSGQANFDGIYEYDASAGEIYNPFGVFPSEIAPVGSYPPNGWGLYDMIGNALEWCHDWSGPYPSGSVTDPQGAVTGPYRVFRGGAWNLQGVLCRSAQRSSYYPTYTYYNLGFRVVLAPNR
jgi:formylglycine-generating enzyme required for sulfatase activity